MNKKIFFIPILITLFIALPIFQGNAIITPEEVSGLYKSTNIGNDNTTLSTNSIHNYDGNTIEVIENTDESTTILMNGTYELALTHTETNLDVTCTLLDTGGLSPLADEQLFDISLEVNETGQNLEITMPDSKIGIEHDESLPDMWEVTFKDMELYFYTDTQEATLDLGDQEITINSELIFYNDKIDPSNSVGITKVNETAWEINSVLNGIIVVDFDEAGDYLSVDWVINQYSGPLPPAGTSYLIVPGSTLSITYAGNAVTIEWLDFTITIDAVMLVFIYNYIMITWYFFFIARIVLMIWDITIVFYLEIIELLIVIIIYTYEIKIYESQIVIITEFIEIILLFISIEIWEFTFIFHFEFWFIQLIFITNITLNIIINPIRFIFIPILIPIFITTIYYVPVYLLKYIHIYLPFASPQMFISIDDEQLQMPEHAITYNVTDAVGNPIDDATVTVDYQGITYTTTFLVNGLYEVILPASNVSESITVHATKSWYPDAVLSYDLEVDWIIDIITQNVTQTITGENAITLTFAAISTLTILLGVVIYQRKRRA